MIMWGKGQVRMRLGKVKYYKNIIMVLKYKGLDKCWLILNQSNMLIIKSYKVYVAKYK